MSRQDQPGTRRIPAFSSVEEEAAFWDSHDVTEFEDELQVVTDVKFVPSDPSRTLTVRLVREAMEALRHEARHRGVDPATLAGDWIRDRLMGATPSR